MNQKEKKMNTAKKLTLWLLGAAFVFAGFIGQSFATNPKDIDIHVSINANKDITAPTSYYYFGAINIGSSSNSVSALTIHNNSAGLTETYSILGGTATSDAAGTDWTLEPSSTTVGTNSYALAVQFSDVGTRPDNLENTWQQDYLRIDQYVICTADALGDGTAGRSGAGVGPGQDRYMYIRIHTPLSTPDGGSHTATIRLCVF